jgi:hypothetical protein
MTTLEPEAGGNAVAAISSAMLKAAGDAMMPYGTLPEAPAILSASICFFVARITERLDPNLRTAVLIQLQREEDRAAS